MSLLTHFANILVLLCASSVAMAGPAYVSTAQDKQLFEAVGAGNLLQAKALIAKGANASAKQKPWGLTPLLIAPDVSREMVKFLLDKKSDVNAADREGITVLMRAVYTGNASIVNDVLKFKPNLDAKGTWNNTALTYAVVQGNPVMVKALVAAGSNINTVRADGMTPLDIGKRRLMQASALADTPVSGSQVETQDHHHDKMRHDLPKGVLVQDARAVLDILEQAGAKEGDEASKNTEVLLHRHRG